MVVGLRGEIRLEMILRVLVGKLVLLRKQLLPTLLKIK